jgi:hypothetical protein
MSKRKNRKKAPAEAPKSVAPPADEQRVEADQEAEPEAARPDRSTMKVRVKGAGVIAPRAPRSVRASRLAEASGRASTSNRQGDKLDPAYIRERLANPTLTVTEEEMRQQYGYVIKDLRSMGLLAAALVVALIILAQILPK